MGNGEPIDQLEQLQNVVDALDQPITGPEIAKAFAVLDQLTAKLTTAAGAFDDAGGWALDASASLTTWLRQRASRSERSARCTATISSRLRSLPRVSAAWRDGLLSSAQVDAVVANLTDATVPLFAAEEPDLLLRLIGLDSRDTASIMRAWAAHAEAVAGPDGSEGDASPEADRSLHLSTTLAGRGELSGHFDGPSSDTIRTAMRLAERPDGEGETRRVSQRRADALVEICRQYLDRLSKPACQPAGRHRHRPHLNIVVDLDTLGHEGGVDIFGTVRYDAACISHLLCDSVIHRVLRCRSSILDYGRSTRTVSPSLFSALVLRDGGCTFEACDVSADRCEAHHVRHWSDGGETNLDNLRLRCWHHHHLVHQPGWWEKVLPDGTVESHAPSGRVFTSPARAGPHHRWSRPVRAAAVPTTHSRV